MRCPSLMRRRSQAVEAVVLCSVEGCDRPTRARGFCATHYRAARRHWLGLAEKAAPKPCKVEGCDKTALTRGYCSAHYAALLKHGDALARRYPKANHPCAVDGCANMTKRQYCNAHEQRLRRYGDVNFKPARAVPTSGEHIPRRPSLSEDQVTYIQENPTQQLAERFGARPSTIAAVKHGRTWGWLA